MDVKALLMSRYDRTGASSRVRMFQYEPYLCERGIVPERQPFFADDYLKDLYARRSPLAQSAGAYRRRLAARRQAGRGDLVWLEKEAYPWLPWALERRLLPAGLPLVSDYDDAVFHRYDKHSSRVVRAVLGDKIDRVMRASHLVMAGNAYLAERARSAGARDVRVVPSVVDTQDYRPLDTPREGGVPTIGWIGSPSTWDIFVEPLLPQIRDLVLAGRARFAVMGAGQGARAHGWIAASEWSEGAEADFIRTIDIGLMPLEDTAWARGKCGFKLIQYMACGVPVIASPVGVNRDIVEPGENGFLARSDADWRDALLTMLADPALRTGMGQAGRTKIVAEYSLSQWGPRVADMLWQVAKAAAA